ESYGTAAVSTRFLRAPGFQERSLCAPHRRPNLHVSPSWGDGSEECDADPIGNLCSLFFLEITSFPKRAEGYSERT
ncbi:hypothetical protein ACC736_40075, partial [Rhizobium ruizarguesonis]